MNKEIKIIGKIIFMFILTYIGIWMLLIGLSGCSSYNQMELDSLSNNLQTYADSVIQAEVNNNSTHYYEHSKLLSDSIAAINKMLQGSKDELERMENDLNLIIRDNDDQDILFENKTKEITLLREKIKAAENYMKQLKMEMDLDSISATDTVVNNIYKTIVKSDNKMLGIYVLLGLFVLVVILAVMKSSNTKKDIV